MEEIIAETLRPILELMRFNFKDVQVEALDDNHRYRANIETDEAPLLIGYHGQNMLALQHLIKILLHKKIDHEFSVQLDVDNYRKRQEENVIQMAEERVERLRKTKRDQKLPPMSSYFRRVVHLHLTQPDFEDITTSSQGQGSYRAVVISRV